MAVRFRTWRAGRDVWLALEDERGTGGTFRLGHDEAKRLRASLDDRLAATIRKTAAGRKAGRKGRAT